MQRRSRPLVILSVSCLWLTAGTAWASGGGGHDDPVAPVVAAIAAILIAARLGGDLAVRLGQPAVLGELLAGVVLGNLALVGITVFEPIESNPHIDILARIGVLVLLFEVGLESTVGQMLKVGPSALLVALLGVAAPFGLGWAVSAWLLPTSGALVHAFVAATLTATSVGITARVLKDLDQSTSALAKVVLGAAVIDDVLGLVILAVITGIIGSAATGAGLSAGGIAFIIGKAAAFLVGSLVIGVYLAPRMLDLASRLQSRGVLLAAGLSFCFLLSWLANAIGLAPLVGAFAAGLVLEDVHYRQFEARGEHTLDQLVQPISSFLVPLFFVLMGMRTDLAAFTRLDVLVLGLALTAAGVAGKLLGGLGVLDRGVARLPVGIGMTPRGEVGLIFANIGLGLTVAGRPVVSEAVFSALVLMVVLTTMATPPALKWSLARTSNGDPDRRSPGPATRGHGGRQPLAPDP